MEKILLVTLGDPAGVGAEVSLKAALSKELGEAKIVFLGDKSILIETLSLLNCKAQINAIEEPKDAQFQEGVINLINVTDTPSFEKCKPTAQGGAACARYIERAVDIIQKGRAYALITAPISKEALKMAKIDYPGHTEMLAALTNTSNYAMMLCADPIRVILVTIHKALKEVPNLIKIDNVLQTIRLAGKACDMLEIKSPKIAVCGLNPHAGEAGMFGDEEINHISPAINKAKSEGLSAVGPLPPDTVFHRAYSGEFDIVVCMYHDQGLIPLKMIGFDRGVNVTVGLPIIRTSPDHGTAYDIAWRGIANEKSMIEAIKLAQRFKNINSITIIRDRRR
ncbi:4-hydroxythreonine-4-phosphate dehydrogenase [Candidatus Magnetoovum chiemensis]|nr:4-hydroxythreonine-4-phosphate dehydrogenase [Candidatus Magnetoovum chiemensis]